jgi:hypothetical protein
VAAATFSGFGGRRPGGCSIDSIAVTVGKHAIKLSDVERDLRLTAFLNRVTLDLSPKAKRQAAERLVDQQIIRTQLAAGGYGRATDAQTDALLAQIHRDRFADSTAKLRATLARYRLTTEQLEAELLWQLTVLQFIQQRFERDVSVSDENVRAYYDPHVVDLRREHPRNNSFETLQPDIRRILEGDASNKDFEDWVGSAPTNTDSISRGRLSMSTRIKIYRNIAIGVAALIIAVVAAALIAIHTNWFRNYVRQKIVTAIQEGTGGVTEIRSFSFDVSQLHAHLTDLVIHEASPRALRHLYVWSPSIYTHGCSAAGSLPAYPLWQSSGRR